MKKFLFAALAALSLTTVAEASYCLKPVAIVEVSLPQQYEGLNILLAYHQQGAYGGLNRSQFTEGSVLVSYPIPWTGNWTVSDGKSTVPFVVTETESPCVPGYVPPVIQVTLTE